MRITLPSGTPAEVAVPEGAPRRGVVIAPDIMGLRPLFDDLCGRLAGEHGWAVCAVEPFPGREGMALEERFAAMPTLDDGDQVGHLVEAADRLGTERTAVLGFCMGGMYATKAAGTGRFDRAVSFYGMIRVPEAWRGPAQGEPLALVTEASTCPILALLGGRDQWTPADDADALRQLGDRVTVVVYPDAEHGFVHDPDRPAHRPDDSADAWKRAAAFLA